jgi:hypothetical protein
MSSKQNSTTDQEALIFKSQNFIIASLILFAVISRVIPHPPNFAPVAAIALFGGALFTQRWLSFLVPMVIMFISDAIIGFHSGMPAIYALFLITVLLGHRLRETISTGRVVAASLTSSVIFFLVSNLVVWYGSAFYPQNLSGLMMSYTMALPFFHYTVLGDLFYSGLLFGSWFGIRSFYGFRAGTL